MTILGSELSPTQQQLWLRHERDTSFSHCRIEIEGVVDVARLRNALAAVVARHEILRTRFAATPEMQLPLAVVDDSLVLRFAELAGPDLEARLREQPTRPWASVGDDGRRDGLRALLAHIDHARHVLVLTAPALCVDERSWQLVTRDWLNAYAAQPAAAEPTQFADFATWHSDLLRSPEALRRQSAPLAKAAAPLASDDRLSSWTVTLPMTATELCRTADPAALLAACQLALSVRNEGRAPTFTMAGDGRSFPELQDAVGPFATAMPLALTVDDAGPLPQLVAATTAALADACRQQHYLDPRIVGAPSAVDVRYRELPEPVSAGGIRVRFIGSDEAASRRPGLTLTRRQDQLDLTAVVSGEVDDAKRATSRLLRLVKHCVAGTAGPLTQLDLLAPGEAEVTTQFGRGADEDLAIPPFVALFRSQAQRTPQAIAVQLGDDKWTYEQLAQAADRLAGQLRARGIGRDTLVAFCLPRRPRLLQTILAIHSAGAAFVPLDPTHPPARQRSLVADVGAAIIVCDATTRHAFTDSSTPRLDLDDEPPLAGDATTDIATVRPDDLAYVMYTSGSSGVPNGVRITQRSLSSYLHWAAATYEIAAGCGALVHSSVAFDLTLTALLAPLIVGQRVLLLPEAPGIAELAATLRTGHDFSLVKLTPTHLTALNQLLDGRQLAGRVRTLVLGGEALYAEQLDSLRRDAPELRIFNEYGPTEATVGCCVHRVTTADLTTGSLPVGRPIANTQLWVLDSALGLQPIGMVGELFISGVGVADGYHARPELTEARFVPLATAGGARVYRTGDRARWRADGTLEFLGRSDEQLKFRGHRIEPAEIETCLRQHPQLSDATIGIHVADDGTPRLVGYVVPTAGAAVTHGALSAWVAALLPAHMVPQDWVTLPALPTTANGKLDRRTLPRPRRARAQQTGYRAPENFVEEVLAALFAHVVEVDRVGTDDNYFALGGDSLRSVRITALAAARGLEFSVAQLHATPTVRTLAAALIGHSAQPIEATPATAPFSLVSVEDRARMPDDVEDAYPLNLLQEGMIFHRSFAPKSAVYHAICSYRLRAPFQPELMRAVIEKLVQRHPLLRTSFDLVNFSRPLQLVHRSFKDPLSIEDLRGAGAAEHEAAVDAWMEHEKQRGFELDEFPLIRYKVHRLTEATFQLTYSFHHEILDGWSDAYMVTELLSHYFSEVYGDPITIAPPQATFRDAIALEHKALATDLFRDFWLRRLEDAQLMRLPRLMSGPKADKGERAIVKFDLPIDKALSDGLKRVARAAAVPLKTIMLAAHVKVMSMMSGQADVMTYTVGNGRPESADGSGVIGLFVNSLGFRIKLPRGSWNDLMLETLKVEHETIPYRRYPMAEIKRQHGSEPLSETLFFFNHYHVTDVLQAWRDVELLQLKVYGESTFPFCVNAFVTPLVQDLGVRIEYDSLQYTKELMGSMGRYYLGVLEGIAADPSARHDERSWLPADEADQLVAGWDTTVTPPPAHRLIHEWIGETARQQPDAIAVVCEDTTLTYGKLMERARRLAGSLRRRGVGPDVLVGVHVQRSVDLVVAILGVLEAGGAYLPLDPSYPSERLRAVLVEARPALVIHGGEAPTELLLAAEDLLTLEQEVAASDRAADAPAWRQDAAHLAYTIYTSGSTGAPKGVAVSHAALVRSTEARGLYYDTTPDRFLLLSSVAFDSSVAGIFWTLTQGGTLVIPSERRMLELSELSALVVDEAVTHVLGVPSLYQSLLDQGPPASRTALQAIIVAGEACARDVYECHRRTLPQVELFNEYGPTEATVWSSVWRARPFTLRTTLPIGRPIANSRIYLLDEYGHPTPIGVGGELHIAGDGLARGYRDRPGLTAERFVPDPFGGDGARLYRTGDLAAYLPEGDIEFLGRTDHQIKIRGFRIEPAEVEAALHAHPSVRQAVVIAREDSPGNKQLVAYVLPQPGATPTTSELQTHVRGRLPKYMIPGAVVLLDALPLTASGKLDRAALPAPDRSRRSSELVTPRNATEEVIAAMWSDVLGLPVVSIHDDFFALGGESLRAMTIMGRLRRAFQVHIPLRLLLGERSTVAGLAAAVDTARWAVDGATMAATTTGIDGEV